MAKLVVGKNDLKSWCINNNKTLFLDEWDYSKNGELTPENVACYSNKKVWWICSQHHSYESIISNRTLHNKGCTYCSGRRVLSGYNDLKTWCTSNNRIDLLDEWDYEKNELAPSQVFAGGQKKYWWKCSIGHRWESTIIHRAERNQGCPYCSGNRVLKGFNDLETINPTVSKEWDYNKNGELTPSMVSYGSGKKVWWVCSKCHNSWQALISGRNYGFGCPRCAAKERGIKQSSSEKKTSFGYLYSDLLNEWDYSKNTISPYSVFPHSNKKVWWKCKDCGNEWETTIANRSAGSGCRLCKIKRNSELRKIPSMGNDLLSTNPLVAAEWNYNKNGDLLPELVNKGSGEFVWWICEFGHEWKARVSSRTQPNGAKCPICQKETRTSFPEQAILFYLSPLYDDIRNGDRERLNGIELDIYIPQIKTAIEYDGYHWHRKNESKDIIKNERCKQQGIRLIRIRENGLPVLMNCECIERRDIKSDDSLETCLLELIKALGIDGVDICLARDKEKIFEQYLSIKKSNTLQSLFPEIASEWHPTKNKGILPSMISANLNRKVWWLGKCGHEWQSSPNNRCGKKVGCPYCSNPPVRILAGFNDLATTNPQLAKDWHPVNNKNISIHSISQYSSKKVWWLGKCGHEWQAVVYSRANGNGCPYCSGEKVLSGYNDLATTDPELLKEWHPTKNIGLSPSLLSRGTHTKVWWLGKCGHEWQASIASRSKTDGTGCPYCAKNSIKKIINLDTGVVYNNLEDAAKSVGVPKSCICRCCLKQRKTSGGYHWDYYHDDE